MRITQAVVDAKEAVQSIKPGDMAEVKSYRNPDPIVLSVVQVSSARSWSSMVMSEMRLYSGSAAGCPLPER